MKAYLAIHKSPLSLEPEIIVPVDTGITIAELFASLAPSYKNGDEQPVMLCLNGVPLPADQWVNCCIHPADRLDVRPLPGWANLAYQLIIAIVVAAVAMSLIDIPEFDTPILEDKSPVYSTDVQANRARLGAPIPDRYGRRRFAPDIAHDRYREFEGNDEYWYLLLSIGHGSYEYHNITIAETSIDNFDDVIYQPYEPGQKVTLFPASVYSAPEVAGQGITLFAPNEPEFSGEAGPYVLNAVGTEAIAVAVDLDFPAGLGYANDEGEIDARGVTVRFEYREIDDNGLPVGLGSWLNLVTKVYSLATFDRLRYTEKIDISAGRYEVRAVRINISADDHREKDEVRWVGLRAYLDDDNTFEHSTLAIKIRSSAQLSSQSERRVLVDCTRMLPAWDGTQWLPDQATRNPAWAFANVIKAEYGGSYTDNNLLLDEIKTFADGCDARGDYYDGHFDVKGTLWSNLQQIVSAARALPVLLGSRYSIVRDEPKVGEIHHFSARHIVRDSTTLRYKTMDHWGDDSVEIEYTDPTTWKPAHITAAIPGSTARKPQKFKAPWITDRVQAHREAMFMAAKLAWRTRYLDFKTELEGRFLRPLSPMLVVQEFVDWGSGGDVLRQQNDILTLSEPVVFVEGAEHYIWLRDRRGRSNEALQVTPVAGSDLQVRVLDTLPDWIYCEGSLHERTAFAFGSAQAQPKNMLLERGRPAGGTQMMLTAVVDDLRVHQYDALINAGTISTPLPSPPQLPYDLTIRSVRVVHGGTVTAPILRIVWNPVPDAKRYFVDVSYDVGVSWQRAYVGEEPYAEINVPPGEVEIRIAAQHETIGAWYQFTEQSGSGFDIPDTPTGLQLSEAFTGVVAKVEWQTDVTSVSWFVEVVEPIADVVKISRPALLPIFELGVDEALLNGLGREFELRVYGVNTNKVRSIAPATLAIKNPQMGLVQSLTTIVSLKTLHVQFDLPSETDFAGFRVWLGTSPGFDTAVAPRYDQLDSLKNNINIPIGALQTYYVRVAAFDVWGKDELTLSGEITDVASGIRDSDLAQALADRVDLIDTPVTGLIDSLLASEAARSAGDGNLQSQIDSLQVSSSVPIYIQADEPTGTIAENSRWFDSDDGNKPYIYKSGVWVDITDQRILDNAALTTTEQAVRISVDSALAARATALEATVDDPVDGVTANRAAIVSEQTARANADSAIASNVLTLQTTVGGHTSSIQATSTAIADLTGEVESVKLEYSVKLDNDGFVTGFGQYNNGPGASGFIIRADTFAVGDPSSPGLYPFVVSGGQIFINGATINSLDVAQLQGNTASFVNANIANASITMGKITNLFESSNFVPDVSGWRLTQSTGLLEAVGVNVSGTVDSSLITASVIQGSRIESSLIVSDTAITVQTDAWTSSFDALAYADGVFDITPTATGDTNGSQAIDISTELLNIVSANNTDLANIYRYRHYLVTPIVNFFGEGNAQYYNRHSYQVILYAGATVFFDSGVIIFPDVGAAYVADRVFVSNGMRMTVTEEHLEDTSVTGDWIWRCTGTLVAEGSGVSFSGDSKFHARFIFTPPVPGWGTAFQRNATLMLEDTAENLI